MYIRLAHRLECEAWPEHIKAYWHAAHESYVNYQAACQLYAEYRGEYSTATNGYLARCCLTLEQQWMQLEEVYRPAVEAWEAEMVEAQEAENDHQAALGDVWAGRHG